MDAKKKQYVFEKGNYCLCDSTLELNFSASYSIPIIDADTPLKNERIKPDLKRVVHFSEAQRVNELYYEKNGIRHGQWNLYYPSGLVKATAFYLEGKLHGPCYFYTQKETLLSESWYIFDEKMGEHKQYYLTGEVSSIQRFKNNQREGKQEYFYENGTLKTIMVYENGKQQKVTKLYYPSGEIKREIHMKDGIKMGFDRFWNSEGILIEEAYYENHLPCKHHRKWHENGTLAEEKQYISPPKLFDFSKWDESGHLLQKGRYQSKDQTYLTIFYDSKQKESYREQGHWDGNQVRLNETL